MLFTRPRYQGVGRIRNWVPAENGFPVMRRVVSLTPCLDHSVWNGMAAAKFCPENHARAKPSAYPLSHFQVLGSIVDTHLPYALTVRPEHCKLRPVDSGNKWTGTQNHLFSNVVRSVHCASIDEEIFYKCPV